MSQVTLFIPRHELSARQNLNDFIALARDHLTLWSDQNGFAWGAYRWPTRHGDLRFINFEHNDLHYSKCPEPHQLMDPAFSEIAKAYLRYTHSRHPGKNIGRKMQALRVMEFVLRQDMEVPDITKFEQRHWEKAVSTLEPLASRQSICGIMHAILATFANFCILTADPRHWRHPYVGRHSYDAINGARASDEAKAKKIPDQDALLAIAEVFSRGASEIQEDTDVVVTCTTGLLMSAPMRIGEILRLRTDCLREDNDRNGERQHFLAYWVPKTQQFDRKGIPKTMIDVTAESIRRLKAITEESRQLARYMETNPEKFYRHANCPDVPDEQELTREQVLQAMGFSNRNYCEHFINARTGSYSLKGLTLNALWRLVLAEHRALNPNFPYQESADSSAQPPLRMSESLFCFRRYQLATRYNTSPVLLAPFERSHYSGRLTTGNAKVESMNFFARNGYKTEKLKSHSLRHLLNRLGRSSGVPIETITKWSSRASTRQTRTYLHDDPVKAAAKGAVVIGTTNEQEPQKPVTNEEANLYSQGPFHRSRYGICRRSWRAGPCNKFADCLNCSELLMCKGDTIAADTIATDRNNLVQTYKAAQQAIANGERAASRWTQTAGAQIERLDQLLAILHNPSIANGSPIEMAGEDFSHERVIVSEKAKEAGVKLLDRGELGINYGEELLSCLDLLWEQDYA